MYTQERLKHSAIWQLKLKAGGKKQAANHPVTTYSELLMVMLASSCDVFAMFALNATPVHSILQVRTVMR